MSRILLSVDEPGFAALYERHAQDVYRFSLYLSGDFALAQDFTAETFALAWVAAGPGCTARDFGSESRSVSATRRLAR